MPFSKGFVSGFLIFNTPFATRCPKKAKSCRNAHKTGPSGATRQKGLTGGVGGRGSFHNTRVQPLVCAVSPANTLATPIPLQLTADAIMHAGFAPNRLLTPCLVVGCCWPSANTQPMKFGGAPSTNIMDRCTRRQCQHSPAAPTGAGGDPQPSPPQGGRLGALVGRESAARSSCSSGSQAWPAIAYGCDIPNFAACSPVVQQHDYGKDHRGTLPAEGQGARDRAACRRIRHRHGERDLQDGRATAPLWCWACYRRPCPAQAGRNRPRSRA